MNPERYEHSGKLPLSGVMLMVGVGVLSAAVLGVAYSYLSFYIGFVKLKFFLALFFGLFVGFPIAWAARYGHIRSRFFPAFIAFASGLVGLYFAWAADFLVRIGPPRNGNFLSTLDPALLVRYVKYFYEHGLWHMDHGVGANNANAQAEKGFILVVYWLAEAATVIGTATATAWLEMRGAIYCEKCERWLKTRKEIRRLDFSAHPDAPVEIGSGNLTALHELPPANGFGTYLALDLTTCDACPDTSYLTVNRVATTIDKKNNAKKKVHNLIRGLKLNPEEARWVRGEQAASAKQ